MEQANSLLSRFRKPISELTCAKRYVNADHPGEIMTAPTLCEASTTIGFPEKSSVEVVKQSELGPALGSPLMSILPFPCQ